MFFDFDYLCKTNVTCLHDYQMIKHFPLFYKEIFVFFNECKKFKSDMSLNALLKEPLWCNKIFVLKNKPVFFKEWLKSGIKYLNDIVNENGLKPAEWFSDQLVCKRNWICEYVIIKTIFSKCFQKYDCSDIQYENIVFGKTSFELCFKNHVYICDINSKLIYDIFRQKQFVAPLHQLYYKNVFEISKESWKSIYEQKILAIKDKKISDFNYRLLNNLLCNREMMKRWKIVENDMCVFCKDVKENNEHLILRCKNVSQIWDTVQKCLNFDVSWKTVVIGFYFEKNEKTLFLNSLISLIACKIYKYKMYCRIENKEEKPQEICNHIKYVLTFFSEVYKSLSQRSFAILLKRIRSNL